MVLLHRPIGALARALSILLALCLAPVAIAQEVIFAPSGGVPKQAMTFDDGTGKAANVSHATPLPVTGGARSVEVFQLATGNTPSAAQTLYGGDYILTQACSAYGTVAFQVLGPNGSTWLTAASYTTADTANGHGATFGAAAQVRVTLTGTTGCAVTLARVPS